MPGLLITDEEAIEIGKQQLSRAFYDMDTARNLGLYRISYNKANWLSKVIYMAECYQKLTKEKADATVPHKRDCN